MIYALYYNNRLQYKRAAKDLPTFKERVYNKKGEIFGRIGYDDKNRHFAQLFNRRFNQCVEGWTIRTYQSYKEVPELITMPDTKAKRDKTPVLNYFYVMDIESTNVQDRFSVCYLYGIRRYDYNVNFNDDTIEQYAGKYRAFYGKRAIRTFYNYLNEINNEAAKAGALAVIYAHNLNYDLFELFQNIFPLFEITEKDIVDSISDSIYRGSAVKVLKFRFKNLVFVDSLALLHKSLKKVSDNHKIKKLVEFKTYKEQYFFGSELPPEELEYNKHDLDVTALGIYDAIRSLHSDFPTFNDFFHSNVMTVTSISRFLNKHIFADEKKNKQNINKHVKQASRNLPTRETETGSKEVDKDRILFYQAVFQGGFTHANPFTAYNNNIFLERIEENEKS